VQLLKENMEATLQDIFKLNGGFLQTKDFERRTQWYQLKKMLENNEVIKLSSGIYKVNDIRIPQKAEIAILFPSTVFCMFTAWNYHKLSTANPWAFHVAVEYKEKVKKPDYPPVIFYYWRNQPLNLGITEIEEEGYKIRIYDLEKSVCDAIRFRNKVGIDTVSEILKNYLKRQDKDLDKLIRYAKILRIEKFVRETITLML